MWDEIENHKTPHSVPYPWQGLNDKTYGLRRSEFVLITADTGVGKTSICKEIEYSLLMNPELIEENVGVGFLHFEEPKYDTAIGLMSIHANKPFHLPDVERTVEELRSAYDAVINNDRVVIWDHFGSNDIDVVLAKIRHMAALGCRYIVLDHLSIVVSDQSGDERKQLDEISTKLKTLTMNLDISCICVIHINRKGEVRGSAGPEQVSNIVMRLERDKKELDPFRRNVTRITIEKNRFCGRTGPACYLYYNDLTNRLEELTDPEVIMAFENGTSMAGHEFDAYGKAS
jgi:twinkle protein